MMFLFQWRTISSGVVCCPAPADPAPAPALERQMSRAPSVHQPLYPPGRIIHIVRCEVKC